MYYGKAKSIWIYHRNGDMESFQVGKKYQLLNNSEIIELEYELPSGYLGATQLDIYIKYVVADSMGEKTTQEVFFAQFSGDVSIEKIVKMTREYNG